MSLPKPPPCPVCKSRGFFKGYGPDDIRPREIPDDCMHWICSNAACGLEAVYDPKAVQD